MKIREARPLQPPVLMPSFRRSIPLVLSALLLASPTSAQHTPFEKLLPCDAYSQSSAVFIGVAGPPVTRSVQLPNQPALEMTLTPVTIERAYFGVLTPVMYLVPAGTRNFATAGQRYLVYGRQYRPPDVVMASPGDGAKPIESAADDLAFLDGSAVGKGGRISGVVQQTEIRNDRTSALRVPLDRILVRITSDRYATETVTAADGRFSVAVPAGAYQLVPELPDDLVVTHSASGIHTVVNDGGCATVGIDAVFNGRVRGVLRGPDGGPLPATAVDLMPADNVPTPPGGEIDGRGSAITNERGEFEFVGQAPGRYYLGVGLYHAPNPFGPSYPRTYYPGTTDRHSATPVVLERGHPSDGYDFSIPMILPKGELEVIVESDYAGELELCFVQLEDPFRRRSTHTPQRGVPLRLPIVDGQGYEVHAHLKYPGGHFESEPAVFTATTEKTVVRLRPDGPRELHR